MGLNIFDGIETDIIFGSGKVINTINPYSYMVSLEDPIFLKALISGDYLIPDGVGITLAARILKRKKLKRITGPNLMDIALSIANKNKEKVFFFGSTPEVLKLISKRLLIEFPNIKFKTYSPPFGNEFSSEEQEKITFKINSFSPDHLFVGMTAPKQEKWVFNSQEALNCKKIYSVGAAFDWFAGSKIRPPLFLERAGLGFIFRLILEPRMWSRQKFNVFFLFRVLRMKFFESSNNT